MALDTYALTTVANVLQYLGLDADDVQQNGLAIYHDATGAVTVATVTVTDTTLVLVATGAATITTTYTFANAADDTLGELVTSINALAGTQSAGWTARLLGPSAQASGDLVPVAATSALAQANEQTLMYQDTDLIEELIDRVTAKVETYTGRKFLSRDWRQWIDPGCNTILLANTPVTAIKRVASGQATALTVRGGTASDLRATVEVQDTQMVLSRFDSAGTEVASSVTFASNATASALVTAINSISGGHWVATIGSNCISLDLHRQGGRDAKGVTVAVTYPDSSGYEYHVDEDAGILELGRGADWGWPDSPWEATWGSGKVLVHYTGGYATVPDDLEGIVLELIGQAYAARGMSGGLLQSESIGSYSYTAAQLVNGVSITSDLAGRLDHWKLVRA